MFDAVFGAYSGGLTPNEAPASGYAYQLTTTQRFNFRWSNDQPQGSIYLYIRERGKTANIAEALLNFQ